jgi:hypothetical protein
MLSQEKPNLLQGKFGQGKFDFNVYTLYHIIYAHPYQGALLIKRRIRGVRLKRFL